ncbi:MAG: cell division protein ZapA [Candidatus Latescibacterota bacterium]|jgi:cell division protein ZapA (FtsZ GTPase activity inhibitor)
MSAKPPSSRIVTVEIFGRTYQFTSDDRDPEYVARAAKYLDEKMRQAAAAVGDRAPVDVAVLAAMEIAQEVLDARNRKAGLLDEADRRLDDVTRRISEKGEATPPPSPRF